jgi:hypothetical protein
MDPVTAQQRGFGFIGDQPEFCIGTAIDIAWRISTGLFPDEVIVVRSYSAFKIMRTGVGIVLR